MKTHAFALMLSCSALGSSAAMAQDANVNIVMTWWGGEQRQVLQNQVVDLFIERNPNVSVERQTASFDNYWQRLAVQSAGGNVPTQMQFQDGYLAQFAKSGTVLRPLDEYVADGTIDVSTIPPDILESGKVDGKLLIVPVGLSYRALYFDGAILDELGVDHPQVGTTWTEYADFLRAIKTADGRDDRWPARNDCDVEAVFFAYLRGHGEQPYDGQSLAASREALIDYLQFWKGLQDEGLTPPADVQVANDGNNAQNSLFSKALVVSSFFPGNQFSSAQGFLPSVEMTSIPVGPEGVGDTLTLNAHAIGATASEEEARAAAEYIDFFLNDAEANVIFNADNGVPTSSAAREAIGREDERFFSLYAEIEDNITPFAPLPEGYGQVRDALARTCEAVQFEHVTVEQGADELIAEAEQALRS